MMIASTFLVTSASNCSACFGSEPSELRSVTFQPFAFAAAAAALATRAWVSDVNWNPITPRSKACAGEPALRASAARIVID
jgi:hypothetical protein